MVPFTVIDIPKDGKKCTNLGRGCGKLTFSPQSNGYFHCPLCTEPVGSWDYFKSDKFIRGTIGVCKRCKILFGNGCTHRDDGCGYEDYYGCLIDSFTYKGIEYAGMPVFNTIDDVDVHFPYMDVHWKCMCNGETDKTKKLCPAEYQYFADDPIERCLLTVPIDEIKYIDDNTLVYKSDL